MTAAVLAVGTPASAVADGFDVKITEVPRTINPGADPSTITVVVSTDVRRPCQKVRWSMLMQVDGVKFDQIKVTRIEDSGSFPLQVQREGDTARLTDARLDPGQLCPGQTVTATYEVSVSDSASGGEIRFQTEAYDIRSRLLQRDNATTEVSGGGAGGDDRSAPTADPSPTSGDDANSGDNNNGDDASRDTEVGQSNGNGGDATPAPDQSSAIAAVPAGNRGSTNLLGVGLIVGAILIFLGVGLLLRLRMRVRQPQPDMTMTRMYDPAP